MKVSRSPTMIAWFLAGGGWLLSGQPSAAAAEGSDEITAVSAKVSNDYVRAKMPDGSFLPETYAFGEGGHFGGPMHDDSIDNLNFIDVARVIKGPLADQNYISGKDPEKTKLLIMVYWGLTDVPPPANETHAYLYLQQANENLRIALDTHIAQMIDAAYSELSGALVMVSMENRLRDRTNFANAKMLGYDREGLIGTDYGNALKYGSRAARRDDMITELEDNRYFVVLMAYDFQMTWKQRKHKLLWETRFSIRQRHHNFDRDLPSMAQYASRYFGQDSHGLLRSQVPEGHVEMGTPTIIEFLFGPKK